VASRRIQMHLNLMTCPAAIVLLIASPERCEIPHVVVLGD
jgi:hypothetical protein